MIAITKEVVTKTILPLVAAGCTLVGSLINSHTEKLRMENEVNKRVNEKFEEMRKQQTKTEEP